MEIKESHKIAMKKQELIQDLAGIGEKMRKVSIFQALISCKNCKNEAYLPLIANSMYVYIHESMNSKSFN